MTNTTTALHTNTAAPAATDEAQDDDGSTWLVLVNAEQQHSLWPVLQPVPAGWQETGAEGSLSEMLAHVTARWIDMRPASLR